MGITWVTPYNLGHFNGDPFRASASSFFWLFLFSDLLSSTLLFSVTLPISTFHLSILSEVLTSKLPSNMYICTRPCRPPRMGWVPYWDLPPPPLWCGGGVVLSPLPPVVWWGCGMVCWVCMVCMVGLVWHVWKVWYVWYVWYVWHVCLLLYGW